MHNFSHVILDLGDVLFTIRTEDDWYEQFMLPLIGQVDRRAFSDLYHKAEHGIISDDEFKAEMELLSAKQFSMAAFEHAWNGRLLDMPAVNMNIVEQLSSRYELYLLSNTNRIHLRSWSTTIDRKFGWQRFESCFKACLYSHDLGVMKPDSKIYERTHQAMGNPRKADCIFLDDSKANIDAARSFGWSGVQVDRPLAEIIESTGLLA